MEVVLVRRQRREHDTIGELYINGEYFCATLEPKDRGLDPNVQKSGKEILNIKVRKYTAIPVYDNYLIHMGIPSSGFSTVGGQSHAGVGRPNFPLDQRYKNDPNRNKVGTSAFKAYHAKEIEWINNVNIGCTSKGRTVKDKQGNSVKTAWNPKVCTDLNDGNHIKFYKTQIFEGVAFHNGADYHNTEGCILVGEKMPAGSFKESDYQIFCRLYDTLWEAHKKGEKIKLKVTYDEQLAKQEEQHNATPTPPNEC